MKTISAREFEAVRNNLTGGFIFMREVYARWEANGGAIVNIAGMWHGWPDFAHSGAAGAAC